MTEIWAHRGASASAPENTMPAFEAALSAGVDGVEFDVQRSRDGQLVVIHDETIDRTSTGRGRVVDLSLDELRAHDYAAGFEGLGAVAIPTLAEVLELFRGTGVTVNVELKSSIEVYPGIEEDARLLVEEMGMADQVLYSSFNHQTIVGLCGKVARERLAFLFADWVLEPWAYARRHGVGALHPGLHLLQAPGYVEQAHAAGLRVHTWTVDDPDHMALVRQLGVDALITNVPEAARR